jgi:hypothetical protein
MKKLIACLTLAAFVAAPAAFAGGEKCKEKAACADKDKVAAKASCDKSKSACKSGGVGKQALLSPKTSK